MRRFLLAGEGWPYLLVPFIPIAVVLELAHAGAVLDLLRLRARRDPDGGADGPRDRGARRARRPGHRRPAERHVRQRARADHRPVRARRRACTRSSRRRCIGSILGNILLVLGAAMFVGGLGRDRQYFNRTAAIAQSSMLLLAVAALVMPAIFELVEGEGLPTPGRRDRRLRLDGRAPVAGGRGRADPRPTSAGLMFSLEDAPRPVQPGARRRTPERGTTTSSRGACARSVIALAVAGVAVGVMSEILVGSISEAAETIGLSEFFIGAIVVAIVGNAAEHWVAVLVAAQGQDGPRGQHRDRLERADRAVRRAGARARARSSSARTRCRSSSTASSSGALIIAVLDRQPGHERGRVDLVQGRAAARGLRRARPRVLVRVDPPCPAATGVA